MPIERALVWAYKLELPNASLNAVGKTNWITERVDSSYRGGGFDVDAVARVVSPDALAIHERVKELSQPGWLSVDMDAGELLSSTYRSFTEPDYFAAAFPKAYDLVVMAARLGRPPGFSEPLVEPVKHENGSIQLFRHVARKLKTVDGRRVAYGFDEPFRLKRGGTFPQGACCHFEAFPTWDQIMQERADYLAYWLALRWLSENLDHLARLHIIAPELPMRPWQALDTASAT